MTFVAPADQRIAAGSAATLELVLRDADGDPDTSEATVTVAVTRLDGTVVLAAGTATTQAGSKHTVALTRAQTETVDRLTCVWSIGSDDVATTTVDVVGRHWFSLGDMRALSGVSKRSDEELRAARDAWADLADRVTGVAWVPRAWSETFVQAEWEHRIVPTWPKIRSLDAVTIEGVAQTLTNWDVTSGLIVAPRLIAPRYTVTLRYRHGYDLPPRPLVDAGLEFCQWALTADRNGVSSRALGFTAPDGGTYRYASATADNPTGLPDVDSKLRRFSHTTLVV